MKKKTEYHMNNATLLLIMAMAAELRGYAESASVADRLRHETEDLIAVANQAVLQYMEDNE